MGLSDMPFSNSDPEAFRRFLIQDYEARLARNDIYSLEFSHIQVIMHHYLKEGRIGAAQKLLEISMRFHSDTPEMDYLWACFYLAERNFSQALRSIDKGLEVYPFEEQYVSLKVDILVAMDRYELARETLNTLVVTSSMPHWYHIKLGNLAQQFGKMEESEANYRKALELDASQAIAVVELGHLLVAEGRHEDAIIAYREFLEEEPFHATVWYHLGRVYRQVGDFDQALEALDFSLAISEKEVFPFAERAEVLMEQERWAEAIQALLEALSRDKDAPDLIFLLASCYEQLEMFPNAIFQYKQLTKLDPENPEAWAGTARCLKKTERYPEAAHFFTKAYELCQTCCEISFALAVCEYKVGNHQCASEFFQASLRSCESPETIWRDWAELLHQEGEKPGAIHCLLKGIKDHPKEANLYFQASAYIAEAGNETECLIFLENGLLIDPEGYVQAFHYFPAMKDWASVKELIRQ
ncbi:MAG: tetratricopeptide repeat protein [Bacteroidota bacterium]